MILSVDKQGLRGTEDQCRPDVVWQWIGNVLHQPQRARLQRCRVNRRRNAEAAHAPVSECIGARGSSPMASSKVPLSASTTDSPGARLSPRYGGAIGRQRAVHQWPHHHAVPLHLCDEWSPTTRPGMAWQHAPRSIASERTCTECGTGHVLRRAFGPCNRSRQLSPSASPTTWT